MVDMTQKQYKMVMDNVELIRNGDYSSADAVVKMISQVTGNQEFAKVTNATQEMAMLHGLVDLTVKLGIPEAADKIIGDIKTTRDKTALKKTAITAAAEAGYGYYINDVMSQDEQVTPDLQNVAKEAVKILLRNYVRSQPNQNVSESEYKEFTDLLTRLDENWGKVDRDGKVITDLSFFNDCSEDAKRLLSYSPTYASLLAVADTHTQTPTMETFYSMYPNAQRI